MPKDPAFITGRLNVDDFVAARRENIEQLENLLGSTGSNAKKRAFQSLPRIERRRAASHHPKRLPRRNGLRSLAEFEAIRDNSLIAKKRKRHLPKSEDSYHPVDLSSYNVPANIPFGLRIRYADRQKNKIWLPTHIWHKKRAFLQNVAGVEIPLTATQKQYRRSYRLTNHVEERGAIAWDTSYISTVVVRRKSHSSGDKFKAIMEKLFPDSTLELYLAKNRKHWQGIYTCANEKDSAQGPALLQWIDDTSVVVQIHHLLFSKLWNDLVVSLDSIDIEDCRYAIGSIDIAGPRALDILRSMVNSTSHCLGDNTWTDVSESGILPFRWAENLFIFDPRIPKKNMRADRITSGGIYNKTSRLDSLTPAPPKDQKNINSNTNIPVALYALDDGRIRLVLPRDWVLVFWLQIFTNRNSVLIGGQKELHQLAFESHCPYFPLDFIFTSEGKRAHHDQLFIGGDHLRSHLPTKKQRDSSSLLLENIETTSMEKPIHVFIIPLRRGIPLTGAKIVSPEGGVIGVVTTGNFSLSHAKGSGIGIIENGKLNENETYRVVNNSDTDGFDAKVRRVKGPDASRIL